MRWAEHVALMGKGTGVYGILVGKPEGKRPLERPRRRWENNIKMSHQDVGCGGMDSYQSGLDKKKYRAVVNVVMNRP